MKTLLKFEEAAQLILGILLFTTLDFQWWWFLLFFLTPDLGMLGYLVNSKVGAITYNLFHHKAIAIALMIFGYFYLGDTVTFAGIILFAHASFDRMLGYGLKYEEGFKFTHLGNIGK